MSLFDKLSKLAAKRSTRSRTVRYERESTRVWVDGEEVAAGDAAIDDDMLRVLAEELGVSTADLDEMLVDEDKGTILRSAAAELAEVRNRGPLQRVQCPECARTVVNRTGSCMYCGAALTDIEAEAATQPSARSDETRRHPVDEKFLGDEVEATDSEEQEAVKNAFVKRLRHL